MQNQDNNIEEISAENTPISKTRIIAEWLVMIAVAVILAGLLRAYVFEVFTIPTGSMIDTVEVGDRVLAEKISYHFNDPQVGDIVTFEDPIDETRTLIKRVIATGGQTIDINDSGVVTVDGVELDEEYVDGAPTYPFEVTLDGVEITYPYTIPDGCIWVMGDNRMNSQDSRYFGAISIDTVTSHAILTIYPFNRIGLLE